MSTLLAHTFPKAAHVGRVVARALDLALVLGGLLAAYGWFSDDVGLMRMGGAVAAGAFLAGLTFLAFTGAALATLWLTAALRPASARHLPHPRQD